MLIFNLLSSGSDITLLLIYILLLYLIRCIFDLCNWMRISLSPFLVVLDSYIHRDISTQGWLHRLGDWAVRIPDGGDVLRAKKWTLAGLISLRIILLSQIYIIISSATLFAFIAPQNSRNIFNLFLATIIHTVSSKHIFSALALALVALFVLLLTAAFIILAYNLGIISALLLLRFIIWVATKSPTMTAIPAFTADIKAVTEAVLNMLDGLFHGSAFSFINNDIDGFDWIVHCFAEVFELVVNWWGRLIWCYYETARYLIASAGTTNSSDLQILTLATLELIHYRGWITIQILKAIIHFNRLQESLKLRIDVLIVFFDCFSRHIIKQCHVPLNHRSLAKKLPVFLLLPLLRLECSFVNLAVWLAVGDRLSLLRPVQLVIHVAFEQVLKQA